MRINNDSTGRCLRSSDGKPRAWFATRAQAIAFSAIHPGYKGDVPVLCMKIGCDGFHLSQPDWPDALAAARERIQ
jgi:hypothetical protein